MTLAINTQQTQIEKDVWIGMGSIVNHDVTAYEVWIGNPAKMIKKRFPDAWGTVRLLYIHEEITAESCHGGANNEF